jgi:hypothetical protein
MDRVRDLVAAGGVSVVLAQDRDPLHQGARLPLLAAARVRGARREDPRLNDRGDESPEGGMRVVRRILPDGRRRRQHDQRGQEDLRPRGRAHAGRGQVLVPTYVGRVLKDDVYRPHSFEEVEALVSPDVAARLDRSRSYGVWWFNRRRMQTPRSSSGTERAPLPAPNQDNGEAAGAVDSRARFRTAGYPASGWTPPARHQGQLQAPVRQQEVLGALRRLLPAAAAATGCRRTPGRKGPNTTSTTGARKTVQRQGRLPELQSFGAKETEQRVWGFVSGFLKDPERCGRTWSG